MYGDTPIDTLIVDDHEDIRLLLRLIIESANHGLHVVGEAVDGDGALEQLDDLNPRVIVLDRMMPGMDGLECAARIRARRPDQVIVMCSAYVDSVFKQQAADMGVSIVVAKQHMADLPDLIRSAARVG